MPSPPPSQPLPPLTREQLYAMPPQQLVDGIEALLERAVQLDAQLRVGRGYQSEYSYFDGKPAPGLPRHVRAVISRTEVLKPEKSSV